jgi:lipopolysaccharide biosynthesis glycosyltransferase
MEQLAALKLDPKSYFNSGVLVIRPQQIDSNLMNGFAAFCKKNPVLSHPDQDFLNFHFKDMWGQLDSKYNHQACVFERSLFMPLSSYQDKVIHYVGKLKPLQGYMAPAFIPFWMYASGIEKATRVFDAAPFSLLEPDPSNINNVIARKLRRS